ncbi:MAG: DMT family transporter [Cyanobacteriota bacterium]|nr:DMT family transporter [Cyanobacteriota bacterium]
MTEQLELTSEPTAKSKIAIAFSALFAVLVLYAWVPILVKFSEYEISPNATILNIRWIGTITLTLWNGLSLLKQRWSGNSVPVKLFPDIRTLLLLLMLAVFSVGHQLLYAWSLTQTTVANSEVLHSLTPLFTTLLGWMLLGQQFDRRFSIGIAIAIVASLALAANDFSITIDKLQGDGLALISAIFWGGYLLVLEKLQTQLSINVITTWSFLLGTLLLLPIVLVTSDPLFPHSWGVWVILALLGSVVVINQILVTYSLKWLSSGLVAAILLLHPGVTAILAWGIFSETLSWLNWLTFIIILLGVYLATSSKGGMKATEDPT